MPRQKGARNGKRARDFTTVAVSPENRDWLETIKADPSASIDSALSNLRSALRGYVILPTGEITRKNGA